MFKNIILFAFFLSFGFISFAQDNFVILQATPSPPSDLKIPDSVVQYNGFKDSDEVTQRNLSVNRVKISDKYSIPSSNIKDKHIIINVRSMCYKEFSKIFSLNDKYKISSVMPIEYVSVNKTKMGVLDSNILSNIFKLSNVNNSYLAIVSFSLLSNQGKEINKEFNCVVNYNKDNSFSIKETFIN